MPEEPKEKLEFLKREEIRTMEKDIARLREEEAKRERERIAALKIEEEARIEREKVEKIKPPIPVPEVSKIKKKIEEILIPKPLHRKLSRFEKIFIRVALVIILILIFTNLFIFWYWYLRVYSAPPPQVLPHETLK